MSPEAPTISLQPTAPAALTRQRPSGVPRPALASGRPEVAKQAPLRRIFWFVFVWLMAVVTRKAQGQVPESVLGAVIIISAAMFPSYLWSVGKVRGLPLFPACALTCTWTFGLPLVSEHPIVMLFPGWNQLVAALSVAGFSLLGTLAWYLASRRPSRPPAVCWMIDEKIGAQTLQVALGICAVYTVASSAGWVALPTGLESIVRALLLAVEALAVFVLSYLMGGRRLGGVARLTFLGLLTVLIVASLPSLLLIGAMTLTAIGAMAYLVASKKLPWRVSLLSVAVFGFLHFGKGEMRQKYWNEDDERTPVAPWQYPQFLSEWSSDSLKIMTRADSEEETGDLLERASLMHWLLYFEATTPDAIPYLYGESYTLIPRLFIPRFLDPDKPRGHEGTVLLSVHYGIQTREDTETTAISFGLLSEAYANFGYWGIAGLAVLLGTLYGRVARWARGMPIFSFRALFAVLIASMSIQAELCGSSYATLLFQSLVVLLTFSAAFMRRLPLAGAVVSRLD